MMLVLFSLCYFTSQWLAFDLVHNNSCTNQDNLDSKRVDVRCLGRHPRLINRHRHCYRQPRRPHHPPPRNARRVEVSYTLRLGCFHVFVFICSFAICLSDHNQKGDHYKKTHNNQRLKGEKELRVPY